MKYAFTFIICLTLIFIGSTNYSYAQFSGTGALSNVGNNSQLLLSPQFPEPGQTVTASLNDYSIDTTGATVRWYVDGSEMTSAKNQRNLTFIAGKLGSTMHVTAMTTLLSGDTLQASATVHVSRVDLLVEANTIAPAFYRGRTVPAVGSVVRVTALPFTGNGTPPSNYSYTWTVDGNVVGGGSQYGKNSLVFNSGFDRTAYVSVSVVNNSGETIGKKSIGVPLVNPELHFYVINPLSGLSEEAMQNPYSMTSDQIQVRAEPYYIDRSLLSESPYIAWQLNGQDIQNQSSDPQEITLRKQGDTGSFNLQFRIRNLKQLLQGVKDSITIRF